MEVGIILFVVLGGAAVAGLASVAKELRRIANALEESNRIRSRQTPQ
jgi:hypothetical protein